MSTGSQFPSHARAGAHWLSVRHVGRKIGRTSATPDYRGSRHRWRDRRPHLGPEVVRYRIIGAAGGRVFIAEGVPYPMAGIEPCDTAAVLRAFGHPGALVLNTLHHNDFRYLRC